MIFKRPLRIESIHPKGRSGLSIQVVDATGKVMLSGFGYFYEDTLRELVAAYNGITRSDHTKGLKKLELTEFAKEHSR